MPVLVSTWNDDKSAARGYFVIDTLKSGLCAGGIRMRPGATLDEAEKLARTMTYKLAAVGIPYGGAKAAIDYDPTQPDSYEVLKRFLFIHRSFVRDLWLTNEDLGTREEDVVGILRDWGIALPFQAAIAKAEDGEKMLADLTRAVGLEVEGLRMADTITGFGVAEATLEALDFSGRAPRDCRAAIQGFGSVGGSAAKYLARAGCLVVAIADVEGTIYCADGLDVEDLLTRRNRWGVISRPELPDKYELLPRDEWLKVSADVLVPAAVADSIRADNCAAIRAGLVVEGANIPTTAEAEGLLHQRGVLVVPDFVANAGAVGFICSILAGRIGPDAHEALSYLDSQIRGTTRKALDLGRSESITPRQAAIRLIEGQRV